MFTTRRLSLCTPYRHGKCRAFSLTELAIVLGVIGVIMAGVWVSASSGRQSAKISQANEDITEIVTNIRGAYAAQAAISGNTQIVVPLLDNISALPTPVTRSSTTTCNTITANYADTPWGTVSTDPCGTLHLCAWNYNTNQTCSIPVVAAGLPTSQVFAVEFTNLDYGTCVSLSSAVTPTAPAGLMDIVINGNTHGVTGAASGSSIAATNTLSPSSNFVTTRCTAGATTNIVDFLYSLRTPST